MQREQRAASPQVCATTYNIPIRRLRAAIKSSIRNVLNRSVA
jgi:hypothetical protein